MTRCVCYKKLVGRGGIPSHGKIHTRDAIGCAKKRIINGTGFHAVLETHLECFFTQPLKSIKHQRIFIPVGCFDLIHGVPANGFKAHVDPAGELRKIDIDPKGVVWIIIKQRTVFIHLPINRILKTVGITRLVKKLVLLLWKFNMVVTPGLRRERAVAGEEQKDTG